MIIRKLLFFVVLVGLLSCTHSVERQYDFNPEEISIMKPIPANRSGLNHMNNVNETTQVNIFTYDGLLQGAGLGILDVNNDGLQDIYYAFCDGHDRLYLNKGDFNFEDISSKAGIEQKDVYSSGISIVDINQDGYDDIYVCRFLYDDPEQRKNILYINQKNGSFKNEAEAYGLADIGYGIMATFFDMDNDNDLDVYIANQPPNSLNLKSQLKNVKHFGYTDRLYRNDNQKFVDITEAAGITNYTYSLAATAFDYNQDGYIDVFVSCDYDEPDILYKNNGDGTFTNQADRAMKHISNFTMGADITDIDNDGLLDLFAVDMVAEDNFRLKTNMSGMNPERFWALANAGYHYQYMFNALHRNNGNGTFSEIAQLSGISNTDWSWAPLFIDFDQDGYRDLVVTNGIVKEVRNSDYGIWRRAHLEEAEQKARQNPEQGMVIDPMFISNKAPSFKIQNFIYRNNGDMTFKKMNKAWNFTEETWSQGAAYADFDNDGDLDLVINNTNMLPQTFQNQANENGLNNYIFIHLEGPEKNKKGLGAVVTISCENLVQKDVMNPYRGYMSTSEASLHFGLHKNEMIDEISVRWPDGKQTVVKNVTANQKLKIAYKDATSDNSKEAVELKFASLQQRESINHVENNYDDYQREILLPHKMSTLGPIIAKADINKDGNDDLYLGGSMGNPGKLYWGSESGQFSFQEQAAFNADQEFEDGGAHFFDMDQDGDLDLYVASGGSESNVGANFYQDRLYKNENGVFKKQSNMPLISSSTAAIVSLDYDGDGDLDLFVGGRQIPGKYGYSPQSYLLENQKGVFSIQSNFPSELGMITTADYKDLNNDGNSEIVLCGDWIGIKVLNYENKEWKENSSSFNLENTEGWWNTMDIVDIDADGDLDILAGNLGLNIKFKASEQEPFKLFVDDFDGNGSNDVYLGYYDKDGKCYPVRGRQCSSQQMPFVKKEFESYSEFAVATIDEVLKDKVNDNSVKEQVSEFRNGYFQNNGKGQFTFIPFSNLGQISPIQGFAILDINQDGKLDFVAAGNYYNREVETTRSDAGTSIVGIQNDQGGFDIKSTNYSGIYASQDVRAVQNFKAGNKEIIGVFNNNAESQFYQLK